MPTAKRHLKPVPEKPDHAAPERACGTDAYESKYQILFDQASDAILTVRSGGEIDAVNQAVEEMTGYHKSELQGSLIEKLVPPKEKLADQRRARLLSAEIFQTPGTYEDVAMLRKDGYIRFVDISVRHVSDEKESLAVALFRDLSEKKRMEREVITKHTELKNAFVQLEKKAAELQAMQEQLVQAGKMAALGELAAGIAHEINQPLLGIRGYAQELQYLTGDEAKGPLDKEAAAFALKEIISNADKMKAIISHLRTFVRKSTEDHTETDVHQAIEEALKMLHRQFASRGIAVQREFGSDVPKVYANPLQLEQVFINLATNARDAIEATGRGDGVIRIKTRSAGEFAEIEFRDNGCGMDARTQQKIFNPFFTTKEVGKGMGLGMSLSYGIMSKLHGSIVVESEVGKGSAFLLRIPRDFRELA